MKTRRLYDAALFAAFGVASAILLPGPALAAATASGFDGSALGLAWVLPFAGILLSIALFPLVAPMFWHHHFGKISLFWALAFLVPFALQFGPEITLHEVLHTALLEYIPFIILVGALFTIAGGIYVGGNLHGSPVLNTALLAIGMVLASFVGTTGASMVMIRPVLRANDDRVHNVHVVVFFIFLVSNIGGSLTPLGDPPLFLGFLKGVDFFWPLQFLWAKMLIVSAILLGVFFLLDWYLYVKEGRVKDPTPDKPVYLRGLINVPILVVLVLTVLASGSLPSIGAVSIYDIKVEGLNIAREAILIGLALLSLRLTSQACRVGNEFNWGPLIEVAKLFAAIFITIIPAIAILRAGQNGELAPLLAAVTGPDGQPDNAAYFWLTGVLSSFLDNAPTYLVFFNAAGGDPVQLMGSLATTLAAISAGAVFMGANTYIGNAPNFMVKAIAEQQGVRMPSFFGYMGWSLIFLIPCFFFVTVLFFL